MNKFRKGIITSMLVLLLSGVSTSFLMIKQPVQAAAVSTVTTINEPKINASAGIAVDVNHGKILFAQDANKPLPIASLTKLLTIYVVLKQIKQGKLSWDHKVSPTPSLSALSHNSQCTNVPLQMNQQYTVRQLYQASLIYSANAAVMLLAQAAAGSQTAAIKLMRQQAKQWHLKDVTLDNTCGLNNSFLGNDRYLHSATNAENKMTAQDVAIIARHLIHDFPEILQTSRTVSTTFNEGNTNVPMKNWNLMLPGQKYADNKLKVDGLKTGTSDAAGACFAGTVPLSHHNRLITIVLHANGSDELGKRFIVTNELMKYVINNWHEQPVLTTNHANKHLQAINVPNGKQPRLAVVPQQDVNVWVYKQQPLNVKYHQVNIHKTFDAPLKQNMVVGKMIVTNNDNLGYLPDAQLPQTKIVTAHRDLKANLFVRMWRKICTWF